MSFQKTRPTIKGLREAFSKIDEATWIILGTMILSVIVLPRLNVSYEMYCAIKQFCKQKCELKPKQL
jgi:hypothetical protein